MTTRLSVKEAQIRHADEIARIEEDVNRIGGDCDIAELVAIMVTRGWIPPATPQKDATP